MQGRAWAHMIALCACICKRTWLQPHVWLLAEHWHGEGNERWRISWGHWVIVESLGDTPPPRVIATSGQLHVQPSLWPIPRWMPGIVGFFFSLSLVGPSLWWLVRAWSLVPRSKVSKPQWPDSLGWRVWDQAVLAAFLARSLPLRKTAGLTMQRLLHYKKRDQRKNCSTDSPTKKKNILKLLFLAPVCEKY